MTHLRNATIFVSAALAGAALAGEPLDFEDETTRINYSLGYQIGGDFKRQSVEMNPEAVVQGIQDALSGGEPKIPATEIHATLMRLKQQIVAEQKKRAVEEELKLVEEGKKFLEENAKEEGVVTTDSGLQYKIIEEGSGKAPGPDDQVTVHYRGTLIDGTEFDSSYKRDKPTTFRLGGVIKGWSEGLQLMKEGGKAQLFIPSDLAYGDRGPLGHRTLIFDVELISVGDGQAAAVQPAAEPADEAEGDQ